MPRISRIRFVSVGPPNARMEDLEIDLRDAAGEPTDTAIWLDNGFGKSTMVNLFFSMIRPASREFVGRQVDQKKLEDYIRTSDHAVVAGEWVLDQRPGAPDLFGEHARLVTGVFIERGHAGEDDRLKRHFFAFYVVPREPRFTLEGLPLYVNDHERWTLPGFRAQLAEAYRTAPAAELVEEIVQKEWLRRLDDFGLDPDLFEYQIRMNAREGGAADLFKFRDVDEFVEFLLEVVQDPELGTGVADAIGKYRKDLRHRKTQLLPERELVEGLIERFRKLVQVASERVGLAARLSRVTGESTALRTHLDTLATTLRADALEWAAQAAELKRVEVEQRRRADERTRLYAAVRLHFTRDRFAAAEAEHRKAEDAERHARRRADLWRAGVPLAYALRHERLANEYLEQLRTAQAEYAPLEQRAREAARDYAAAVLARIAAIEAQQAELEGRVAAADEAAEAERAAAETHTRAAAEAKSEAEQIRSELRAVEVNRKRLVGLGALEPDETAAGGRRRWILAREEALTGRKDAERGLHEARNFAAGQAAAIEELVGEQREAAEAARTEDAIFDAAAAERASFEKNPLLLECLEVKQLDLDTMPDANVARVQREAEGRQSRVYQLWSESAETERLLDHVERTGLLPPSRETEAVLVVLRGKVNLAVSGWEYAARSLSVESGEARAFILRAPHLATGVIVRDVDLNRARDILDASNLEVDAPVVVAPESAVREGAGTAGFVLAPASDAHFDARAGSAVQERKTATLAEVKARLEREEAEFSALRELSYRLGRFRERYARGWFTGQEERVRRTQEWAATLAARVQERRAEHAGTEERVASLAGAVEHLRQAIEIAERQTDRIDSHLAQYGENLEERRARVSAAEERARTEEVARQAARARANDYMSQARELRSKARSLATETGGLSQRRRQIEFLDGEDPAPAAGDLAELEARYTRRVAQYRREVGEETLRQLAENERQRAREQREKVERHLPEGVHVQEVADLVGDATPEEAEQQREADNAAVLGARGDVGRAAQERTRAKTDLDAAETYAADLLELPSVVPGERDVPGNAEDATPWLAREEKEIERLRQQAQSTSGEALQYESEARDADHRAESVEKDAKRLGSLRQSYDVLVGTAKPDIPDGWRAPSTDAEIGDRINRIEAELVEASRENHTLDQRRDALVADVNHWTEGAEFAHFAQQHAMVRGIRSRGQAEYERDAAEILGELDLRLRHIVRTIAAVDEHRATLVEQLLSAAERGVQLLESAERQSQLPAHMPRFGKVNFLKVRLGTPKTGEDRRGRMEILLEEVIEKETIPSGPKLMQEAVKRLAHPINVDMLFPDPLRPAEYRPVERMGINSGGEQLTCAVLLYCTLAQLRARNRGQHRVTTSTLILDNPFGTASRVSFLDLQLEVARAARIQLVYTTGVKDYDAIAVFPNVNRIRPSGFDTKNREFLLERDALGTGMAMAQLFKESKPAAVPE